MSKKALLICMMAFALIFTACGKNSKSTETLLSAMLLKCGESIDENGYMYLLNCEISEDEANVLNKDKQTELYGEHSQAVFEKIEECSVFVFANAPGELALFKCYSRSDRAQVERMCLERSDTIKVALRNTPWEEKSRDIRVGSIGSKYVFFAFTENNDGALEALEKQI